MKMIKNFPYWIHRIKSRLKQIPSTEEHFHIPLPLSSATDHHRSEIRINDLKISHIEVLGNSKSGRISWKGELGDRAIKICQLFNSSHVKYVEFICNQPLFKKYFPEIIASSGEYLIVDWIDGDDLSQNSSFTSEEVIENIARMQAEFHRFTVPADYSKSGFDYIHHLKARLQKYLGPIQIPGSMLKIIDAINEIPMPNGLRLSHSDVTPRNIIMDRATNESKLIDNEFLSSNGYYSIDIFNTYRSIRHYKKLVKKYLIAYQKHGGNLKPILDQRQFYLALWGLRMIVTQVQAGHIGRAFQLADEMVSNQFNTHPLIKNLGELIA